MRFRRRRLVGLGAFLGVVMVLSACAPSGPKPKSDFFGNINGAGYNNWHGDFPDGMVMWDPATAKY